MPLLQQATNIRPRICLSLSRNHAVASTAHLRHASHWYRHGPSRAARDASAKQRSNHNETASGKRQQPSWKSITLTHPTQETESLAAKSGRFAQASSFTLHASHEAASGPVVEASSSSWDSETNRVSRSVYDPISGRMILTNQASSSIKDKDETEASSETYMKPTILSENLGDQKVPVNPTATHASFTEDFEKSHASEHEALLAARRHLDTLREQVQLLERQIHPQMSRPDDAIDAERPEVYEGGWDSDPKGLQTAFEHEKKEFHHGSMGSLEQEMVALNKKPAQEINDDYSVRPSGMETLFAHEKEVDNITHHSSLEDELVAMNNKASPIDDGYSPQPKGLETLFEQERQQTEHGQRKSLEHEIGMTGSVKGQSTYNDGNTTESNGLETMYDREAHGTPQTLEHELEKLASDSAMRDPDDAFSTEPSGMQTLYQREEAECQSGQRQDLEHELHQQTQTQPVNDGYSTEPEGLQTLWQREQTQVEHGGAKSLEEEIHARQPSASTQDEHVKAPFGMETQYHNENQHAGTVQTLEEEVKRRFQGLVYDDAYSHSPIGLQTAFAKEEKDAMLGRRQSLEKDMTTMSPAFEDGYSTMPMGLQMEFLREKRHASQGSGRSLEDDLKQMEQASYHEDGYSRAPVGMEKSFEKETHIGPGSLEAELKSESTEEGEYPPAVVGKFDSSDKWCDEQPAATSTVAKQSQKTGVWENEQLDGKSSNDMDPKRPHTISSIPTPNNMTTSPSLSAIKWADPPLYKIIVYDSSNDTVSTTTTPACFSDTETPISIPFALSRLNHTARFVPPLASLQETGFQVIQAEQDFLILRKVHQDLKAVDGHDGASTVAAINPVDGTTARYMPLEPSTARYASPTGFALFDDDTCSLASRPNFAFSSESNTNTSTRDLHSFNTNNQVDGKSKDGKRRRCEERHAYRQSGRIHRRRQRRVVWVLSVVLGTAGCVWVFGVVDELFRPVVAYDDGDRRRRSNVVASSSSS